MKEQLLIAWKQKYERVQWELGDNQKKLENVEKRKKELIYDLVFQFSFAIFCFLLLYCIAVNRYEINAEQACIEWLLHEYAEDMKKLIVIKRKIEETPEQNLDPLWKELESIVFYERVGRARG